MTAMEIRNRIDTYISEESALLHGMDTGTVNKLLEVILDAYEREASIYVFGNGGSSSTASHLANDFNKGISEYVDKKFHVTCLNDNMATILSVANDIGYRDIFSFQLKNRVKKGDVVIGISGSGNSQNVVDALEYAKTRGAITVGWVGFDGGKVSKITDITFHVPINDMQLVEDMHMVLTHLLMSVIMQMWGLKGCN